MKNTTTPSATRGVATAANSPSATYQPPAVESVITPQQLEREAFYAGVIVISPPPLISE